MIKVRIPGKLYVMGEYSVMKSGNNAILVAVNKFIDIETTPADDWEFSSELGRFKWMNDEGVPILFYDSFTHAKAAIYIAHLYLKQQQVEPLSYHIKLSSQLSDETSQKYGLGSSGAVIVGVIKSILLMHGIKVTKKQLFKLSVMAQVEIGDVTSGGELAASIYGGWVHYRRYDYLWVINNKGLLTELVDKPWPHLTIEQLNGIPFRVVVCYSGLTQDTKSYSDIVSQKGNNHPWYLTFLSRTQLIVSQFKEALIRYDFHTVKYMIDLYRKELLELEKFAEITIVSKPFEKILDLADKLKIPAKTSGAGYGDCAIAITRDETEMNYIKDTWQQAQFKVLDIRVWKEENDE